MLPLFAQAVTTAQEASPWISGGATAILAGVVVWLAKAYRDDMKERANSSVASHEKVASEFKKTSEETRDKFLTALDKQKDVVSDLCDSVRALSCQRYHETPTR